MIRGSGKSNLSAKAGSIFLVFVLWMPITCLSQNNRIQDNNTISWITSLNSIRTGKSTSLHLEYQFRRIDGFEIPMQHLFRIGINYTLSEKATLMGGFAYVLSYPYSEYPMSNPAVRYPEIRSFEQVSIKDETGRLSISHRFRLEQRWIGRMDSNNTEKVDSWSYVNRLRYLIRLSRPIIPSNSEKGGLYGVIQNELFIGFGRNVKANVFDQNRLGILLGTRLSKYAAIEIGYLNQILQQSSLVNNQAVFQNNKGVQAAIILNK